MFGCGQAALFSDNEVRKTVLRIHKLHSLVQLYLFHHPTTAELFCMLIVMVVTSSCRSVEIPKIGCPGDDDATKHDFRNNVKEIMIK